MKLQLLILATIMALAFAANGDPTQFGNNTTTTAWIGGSAGIVNATGSVIGQTQLCINTSCKTTWPATLGTVTEINTSTGITGGPITTTGTIGLNTTYLDTLYCILTGCTVSGNVTASNFLGNLNWSYLQNIPAYVTNYTDEIDAVNATAIAKASPGDCAAGYVVQNTTTGGVECVAPLFSYTETDPLWAANESRVDDLETSNTSTNLRIDSLNTSVAALEASNTSTNGRIDTLNTSIQNLESSNTTTNSRIDTLDTNKANRSGGETITGNWIFTNNVTVLEHFTSVNVTTQNINGSQYPAFDNLFDLGNSTNRWMNAVFSGYIIASDLQLGGTNISSNFSALTSSNTTTNARIDTLNVTVISLNTSNTTTNSRIDTLNSTKINADGTTPLTANWNAGAFNITAAQLTMNSNSSCYVGMYNSTCMIQTCNGVTIYIGC